MAYTFLGAKLESWTATAGRNGSESVVQIVVVEDPTTSSYFETPTIGTPKRFQVGDNFTFDGIIQNWKKRTGADGVFYDIQLVSPDSFLDGTTVVMAGDASNMTMPNLLNVYGYYENLLFGASNINDTGMEWAVLSSGVHHLTATTGNSKLQWKGHTYSVNISSVTSGISPPSYYRVRGEIASLNEVIGQVCQDAGFDYITYLTMGTGTHHTIDFTLIDRGVQPSLTFASSYVTGATNIAQYELGREFRNEPVSAFLVGGDVHYLQNVEDTDDGGNQIWPFWGWDVDGNVIVGTGFDDNHAANLNAAPIIDIMGFLGGGAEYHCTVREMRCALHSYDSWANFLNIWKQSIASAINLRATVHLTVPEASAPAEWVQDGQDHLDDWSDQAENNEYVNLAHRLYEFVRGYAAEFYGRKFLVRIPNYVQYRLVPDTLNEFEYDFYPTKSAFVPDGSTPIGLDYLNELFFLDQEGKLNCFVRYDDGALIDLNSVAPERSAAQPDGTGYDIYTQSEIYDYFVAADFGGGTEACAIVDLGTPLTLKPEDPWGGISSVAETWAGSGASLVQIQSASSILVGGLGASSPPPIKLVPAAFKPDAAAIPIKTNRIKYGPWTFYDSGSPGKVYYEQDDSLTPWQYGDFNALNAAASGKLQNIVSNTQESEYASITFPGIPGTSLGGLLSSGGPNITQISMDFRTQGIKTTYQIETYSHRLYRFYNERANQIRRIGTALQQFRRNSRMQFFAQRDRLRLYTQYRFGQMSRYAEIFNQQSPHHCMVAHIVEDTGVGRYDHVSVSVQKYRDSIFNVRSARAATRDKCSVVGLDTIFAPFATYTSATSLPQMRLTGFSGSGINATSLNPFRSGNNFDWVTRGTGFQRLHQLHETGTINWSSVRGIGFRLPAIAEGWGYELYTSRPVPNSSTPVTGNLQSFSGNFASGYLSRPSSWIAAPIDFRYDKIKGLWTMPGTLAFGSMVSAISGVGSSGELQLMGQSDKMVVYNFFSASLSGGTNVVAARNALDDRWYVVCAQC